MPLPELGPGERAYNWFWVYFTTEVRKGWATDRVKMNWEVSAAPTSAGGHRDGAEETRADFRFFECKRLKLPKSPETSPDLHQELPLATPTFENSSHLRVWSDGKLLSQHQTPAAAENTAEATLLSPCLSFTICGVSQ